VLELVFSPLAAQPTASERAAPVPGAEPRVATPARPIPLTTWIAGGVSLAGLTAGVVLGASAVSQRNDLRASCAPHCSTSDVDQVRREAVLANVAFGVGLSAAALAVVSYVMAPTSRPSAAAARRLSVAAGPDADGHGGRVMLGGQF
jgi:hypothetical protein